METRNDRIPAKVYTLPPRRTAGYRPLGDSGPAGQLEARDMVTVVFEGDFGLIELEQRLVDGRYRTAKVTAVGPDGGWLDLEDLRRVNYRRWIRRALTGAVRIITPDGTFTADDPMSDPDPLWPIALTYMTARATGDNPTAAVADDFRLSRGAAAQRVKRARDKGYLPATTPGKVS